MYAGVARAYLLDPQVQQFLRSHNPWALRDMSERLLEAHQRGYWQEQAQELLPQIEALMLEMEAQLEASQGSLAGER
jgi:cobaltochelatase CobN